jgi:hypothetical protein
MVAPFHSPVAKKMIGTPLARVKAPDRKSVAILGIIKLQRVKDMS